MDKRLFIYGAGGHARVVAATARLSGYEIAGFLDDDSSRLGEIFEDAKIVSLDFLPENANMIVAFGNCSRRLELGMQLRQSGFRFPVIVHPSAQIAKRTEVGTGSYIGALVALDTHCHVGDFSIINNQAGICHDAQIAGGRHICPSAILVGNVTIEQCCSVGLGSRIIEDIIIGGFL